MLSNGGPGSIQSTVRYYSSGTLDALVWGVYAARLSREGASWFEKDWTTFNIWIEHEEYHIFCIKNATLSTAFS